MLTVNQPALAFSDQLSEIKQFGKDFLRSLSGESKAVKALFTQVDVGFLEDFLNRNLDTQKKIAGLPGRSLYKNGFYKKIKD